LKIDKPVDQVVLFYLACTIYIFLFYLYHIWFHQDLLNSLSAKNHWNFDHVDWHAKICWFRSIL